MKRYKKSKLKNKLFPSDHGTMLRNVEDKAFNTVEDKMYDEIVLKAALSRISGVAVIGVLKNLLSRKNNEISNVIR